MTERLHTDRAYESELGKLREQLLLMGARVEEGIGRAMTAFRERDLALARRVIDDDKAIDQLEIEIDELALSVLARRQPVASDLRLIITIFKIVTDLERIGDLVVHIGQRVLELGEHPPLEVGSAVNRMADVTGAMLRDSLDAFVRRDAIKAEEVLARDSIVDTYYAQLFPELIAHMMRDPALVYPATRLQSIGKYLERIADHATNLAEMVVFMVKGKDVRHHAAQG